MIKLAPGRGVLMRDVLRPPRRIEGFHDSSSVVFIEMSAPLREEQGQRVPDAEWAPRLEDAPPGPSLIVGNEFLDCLPIRQFVRGEDGWHEKLVGVAEDGRLTFGLSAALPAPASDDEPGAVREIATGLESLIYEIERRLHDAPGRVLLIDYGYVEPEGADDWVRSLAAGERVMIDPPTTIADGVRTRQPGVLTFAVIRRLVDAVVTVSDDQIREALRFMVLRMKTVVEPTGAIPTAALMSGAAGPVDGLRVGVIISGGNVDPEVLCDILTG